MVISLITDVEGKFVKLERNSKIISLKKTSNLDVFFCVKNNFMLIKYYKNDGEFV